MRLSDAKIVPTLTYGIEIMYMGMPDRQLQDRETESYISETSKGCLEIHSLPIGLHQGRPNLLTCKATIMFYIMGVSL